MFYCLGAFFALQYGVFAPREWPTTRGQFTIAIACCDGKKVKLARFALFTMSLLLYLSDVYYKVS